MNAHNNMLIQSLIQIKNYVMIHAHISYLLKLSIKNKKWLNNVYINVLISNIKYMKNKDNNVLINVMNNNLLIN